MSLTYLEAIVIGGLQGVSELFPVSSLGHSVLLPAIVGGRWAADLDVSTPESPYLAFIVGLHVATALALLVFFRRDWVRIIGGLVTSIRHRRVDTADQRLAWLIVVATIPVGLAGLLLEHVFRTTLGRPVPAAAFLIANGVVLYVGERLRRRAPVPAGPGAATDPDARLAELSVGRATLIGSAQILALLAGISRSGVTMVAGLLRGLSHEDAARFAFLLATPVILAAGVLKIPDLFGPLGAGIHGQVLAGSVASFVTAYVAVRFLTRVVPDQDTDTVRDLLCRCRHGSPHLADARLSTAIRSVRTARTFAREFSVNTEQAPGESMVFDPTDVAARKAKLANSIDRPSAARIYDYFIGGEHNFAIDRQFAETLRARIPKIGEYATECRLFMGRVVRYAAEHGYTQFVDIGSGLPTAGSVHEIADAVRPRDSHVVYIDNEPIAFAHAEMLLDDLADASRHRAVYADLLDPLNLWQQVGETGVIDTDRPIVLLLSAVLHFIKDEANPDDALAFYRRKLPAGSLLVLSQMSGENPRDAEEETALRQLEEFYEKTTNPGQLRGRDEFARFFGDFDLIEPGLVWAPDWHPDGRSLFPVGSQSRIIGGVGRKR